MPSLGQHVAVCAYIAHAIFNRLRETHRPRASAHRDSAPPPTTFVDPPFFAVVGHDDKVEPFWVLLRMRQQCIQFQFFALTLKSDKIKLSKTSEAVT